jgi:hypothetical protein
MDLHTILLIGHIIGVALGAGGATTSDFLFLSILRNGRIEKSEFNLLKVASGIVISGLMLLTATGLGLIILNGSVSHRFFAKMTIVLIAAVNGGLMHIKLFPHLQRSAHKQQPFHLNGLAQKLPRVSVFGAVSAVSWYAALVLGAWRNLSLGYAQILAGYVAVLLLAMLGLMIGTRWLLRKNAPPLARPRGGRRPSTHKKRHHKPASQFPLS